MLAKQPRVQPGPARRPAVAAPALLMAGARLPPLASSSSSRRRSGSRARVAAKLDEVPLFASGDSLMSGPSPTSTSGASAGAAGPKTAAEKINAVPLNSESGIDYAPLRDALLAADFRAADDETRALLIRLAGPGAVKRGWVYFTEVAPIPSADLATIDDLWRAASDNRFGFTVQREMFAQNQRRWQKFFKQIDWVQGENNVYRKWPAEFEYSVSAPKGHLPLTNALRGTQLFEALLAHPAFQRPSGGVGGVGAKSLGGLGGGGGGSGGSGGNGSSSGGGSSGNGTGKGMSIDERARLAGQNTLNF